MNSSCHGSIRKKPDILDIFITKIPKGFSVSDITKYSKTLMYVLTENVTVFIN